MIYFDAPAKAKLMEKFMSVLKPGGYFIIGFFDSLLHEEEKENFEKSFSNLRIFKKKSETVTMANSAQTA